MIIKLDYCMEHKPKVYDKMADIIMQTSTTSELKHLIIALQDNPQSFNSHQEIVIKILLKNPDLASLFDRVEYSDFLKKVEKREENIPIKHWKELKNEELIITIDIVGLDRHFIYYLIDMLAILKKSIK